MEDTIGSIIKKRRKEIKMTQCDLAKASKVARGTISALENGKSDNVLVGTLKAIANTLDIPLDSFFA